MAWILLLLAAACFLVPAFTTSFALGALSLVLALILMVIAFVLLLAGRMQGSSRSDVEILSPAELHALRERAKTQRHASRDHDGPSDPSGDPPSVRTE
jgi:hypothetical protein